MLHTDPPVLREPQLRLMSWRHQKWDAVRINPESCPIRRSHEGGRWTTVPEGGVAVGRSEQKKREACCLRKTLQNIMIYLGEER